MVSYLKTAIKFSIHSPLAGRDLKAQEKVLTSQVFNPLAPCGARPKCWPASLAICCFSIHSPLAGRDHSASCQAPACWFFNPLAPCGARHACLIVYALLTYFQSTRPLRGETMKVIFYREFNKFSIHSPLAGRDRLAGGSIWLLLFFNPLAPCGARQQTITKIVCKRYSCCTVHFPTNPPRGASGRKTGCASRKTGIHLVRTYREFGVRWRFAIKGSAAHPSKGRVIHHSAPLCCDSDCPAHRSERCRALHSFRSGSGA